MANRISVIIDATVDKALGPINNFKKALQDAETNGTSKLKAGAASAFESVKENAGAMALAGGAALVSFGVKAVGAFTDTAKAAIDLGGATGLATEDASRWIAIGDDFGVGAEQLAGGIGKIAKSLDDTKWGKYGIATRDAAGQARDANDILLDSLTTLSGIQDATERARAGNELFGKGYANLAPLIGHTRDEYEDMLSSVEKGQVITEKEAAKAERMRLAQDALSDALQEVTLAVGGFVAELAPMIETAAAGIGELSGLIDKFEGLQRVAVDVTNPVALVKDAMNGFGDGIQVVFNGLEELNPKVEEHSTVVEDARDRLMQLDRQATYVAASEDNLKDATQDSTDAYARQVAEIQRAIEKRDELTAKELSAVDASYAYFNQAIKTNQALEDYNTDLEKGKLKGDELRDATEQMRQKLVDTATAFADQGGAAKGSQAYVDDLRTSLENQIATLAPDSPLRLAIQGYIDALNKIPARVATEISATVRTLQRSDGTYTSSRNAMEGRASGGDVLPGRSYIVGEDGPEILNMGSTGGNIVPNHRLSAGTTVIIGDRYIEQKWRSYERAAAQRARYGTRIVS